MAAFRVYSGRDLIGEYFFDAGPVLVGRNPNADIFVAQDVVSRRHAVFKRAGRSWFVENAGGQNGIFVNGRFVNEQSLSSGDKIEIGRCVIHFINDDSSTTGEFTEPRLARTTVPPGEYVEPEASPLVAAPTRPLQVFTERDTDDEVEEESDGSTITLTIQQMTQLHAFNQQEQRSHLRWTEAGGRERIMVIPDRPLVLGRGRSADITVKGGLGIGNRFARVMKNSQGTYLERCSRLVTVEVNGEAVKGVCDLADGDSIHLCDTTLTYCAGLFDESEIDNHSS